MFKDKISEKKRFLDTMLGDKTDRFPFFDLEPDEETIERWHKEGLPRKESVTDYFKLETHHSVGLVLRSYPFFKMAPDLLTDPSAFDRHYDPEDPSRYGKNFIKRAKRLSNKGHVLYIDASGGGLLQMLGVGDWDSFKAACRALILEPRKVEDLINKTTEFYCICLEQVLSKVSVDYASFYEPIASNIGPVISPDMFKRYSIPGYKKIISLLEKYNVPLRVFCSTGGNLIPLLKPLIDIGINTLWISNISVNMEYTRLRSEFGDGISLIGGIDSGALRKNGDAIRATIEKTAPPLLERGRYLPCLDDRPRADISFSQYRSYRQLLQQLCR